MNTSRKRPLRCHSKVGAHVKRNRFLKDHANDEEQYKALMTAGIQFARDYGLISGVALTADQMARLTTDIVWLVAKEVILPEGTKTTALATSATLAIINNKGDIGAALKELGSKENIKSLVTAMATAGLVQGLGAALNLPSTGLGSSFLDKLQTNLVNGIASSLITTAINGGSVEDALKNAVKGAVINSIAAQGANGIGDLTRDGKLDQTALENFANKFAHAVLGCATGAATANSQAGCAAGAVGAVAGSLGAELYDPKNVKGVDAQQFGKLTASLAVLLAGGDAKLVNVAGTTAVNAIANNRQLHPKEIDRIKELADQKARETCNGNTDCYTKANLYWTDMLQSAAEGRVDNALANKNTDYYNQVINAAGIAGSEASVTGASVFYFNNLKSAQELLNADAGKPILMPNGQVQLGSDGKPQAYFSATDAQKADPFGNIFPGGLPSTTSSVIPGKTQRDLERIERLVAPNGTATPIYPVEEVFLGGAVAGRTAKTFGSIINGNTITVYRVEGLPNTRIIVGEGGNVAIEGEQTLFLNFGSKQRAEEFLNQRIEQGMQDVTIKSFQVEKNFYDSIKASAVPERLARQNPGSPILVDPTKAANQFGIRPNQFPDLLDAIIKGSGKNGK